MTYVSGVSGSSCWQVEHMPAPVSAAIDRAARTPKTDATSPSDLRITAGARIVDAANGLVLSRRHAKDRES